MKGRVRKLLAIMLSLSMIASPMVTAAPVYADQDVELQEFTEEAVTEEAEEAAPETVVTEDVVEEIIEDSIEEEAVLGEIPSDLVNGIYTTTVTTSLPQVALEVDQMIIRDGVINVDMHISSSIASPALFEGTREEATAAGSYETNPDAFILSESDNKTFKNVKIADLGTALTYCILVYNQAQRVFIPMQMTLTFSLDDIVLVEADPVEEETITPEIGKTYTIEGYAANADTPDSPTGMYAANNAVLTVQEDGSYVVRYTIGSDKRPRAALAEDVADAEKHAVDWYESSAAAGDYCTFTIPVAALDENIYVFYCNVSKGTWSNKMFVRFDSTTLALAEEGTDPAVLDPAYIQPSIVVPADGKYVTTAAVASPKVKVEVNELQVSGLQMSANISIVPAYNAVFLGSAEEAKALLPVTDELPPKFILKNADGSYDIPVESLDRDIPLAFIPNVQQRLVTAETSLNFSSENLVAIVPADYTGVDAAIASIPENISRFNNTTVEALQAAIDAVDRTKTAEEQAEVDAMAEAIETAIANLTYYISIQVRKTNFLEDEDMNYSFNNSAVIVFKDGNGEVIDKETLNANEESNGIYYYHRLRNSETYTVEITVPGHELVEGVTRTTDQGLESNYYEGKFHYRRIGQEVYTQTITGENAGNNLLPCYIVKENPALPELRAALAAVPADLSLFTEETAQAVTAALANADESEESEEVMRAAATALLTAVQNLIPKDGWYVTTIASPKLPAWVQVLKVKDGQMTMDVMLKTESYDALYFGSAADAANAAAEDLNVTVGSAPNPNNANKNASVFENIPVEKFAKDFAVAPRSKSKGTFTDHVWAVSAADLAPIDMPVPDPVELEIVNNTAMFKGIKATIEEDAEGNKTLELTLSGTGYSRLFMGTYEDAVANNDNTDNYIIGEMDKVEAGKYTFSIPLTEGVSYMPIVAISSRNYDSYKAGTSTLEKAFYPRQAELDLENGILTLGDYDGIIDLAVTNTVKMFSVKETAQLETVGGPNSNGYKEILYLPMGSTSFDQAFVGSAEEAAAAETGILETNEDNEFVITVKENAMGGAATIDYLEKPVVVSFHSVKKDEWYERELTVSKVNGTLVIKPVEEITVNVTVTDAGAFAQTKDDEDMILKPVVLTGKSAYTMGDAILKAHEEYCAAGAAGMGTNASGWIVKMWGEETSNCGYQLNAGTVSVMSLEQAIADGDYIDVAIYRNVWPYTEAYSVFDSYTKEAASNEDVTLTLKYFGYDANYNFVSRPCADAVLTINGEETEYETAADGTVTIPARTLAAGEYVISAVKTKENEDEEEVSAITAPVCILTVIAADPEPIELEIVNNTGMFKGIKATIVEDAEGNKTLELTLSGTGYSRLFMGTYEDAVANNDNTDNYIIGEMDKVEAGKYTFSIPLTEGVSYMPIVAISSRNYDSYKAGTSTLEKAFYPRQAELDLENNVLTLGDFDGIIDLAVTNNVKMFSVQETARLETVGGPNSNNYKEILYLPMKSTSFDKAYVGSAEEAAAAETVIAVNEDNEFVIDVKANAMGGSATIDYLEKPVVVSFHSVSKDAWYERELTVSKANATLLINEVTVPATGITVDPTEAELEVGAELTITATVEPSNATVKTVTWASSKESVAVVSENGVVTAMAKGTAVITATCGDVSAQTTITVVTPQAVKDAAEAYLNDNFTTPGIITNDEEGVITKDGDVYTIPYTRADGVTVVQLLRMPTKTLTVLNDGYTYSISVPGETADAMMYNTEHFIIDGSSAAKVEGQKVKNSSAKANFITTPNTVQHLILKADGDRLNGFTKEVVIKLYASDATPTMIQDGTAEVLAEHTYTLNVVAPVKTTVKVVDGDNNDAVIADAEVVVTNNAETPVTVKADAEGNYLLDANRTYVVRASVPETEYTPAEMEFTPAAEVVVTLTTPADYSKVDEALAKVPTDEELKAYTDESVKALKEAVAAAENADRDLTKKDQDQVDAMADAIEKALAGLTEKPAPAVPADYSKVDAALKKVPKDLSGYTKASADALKKAVAAVKRGLNSEDQAKVDKMAKDIEAAIKGLKKDLVTMYRLYNPNSGEHFYTGSAGEKNALVKAGWKDEGIAWYAPKTSKTPVYRLYNPNAGDHHYTTNAGEKNALVKVGWKYEGIGWYSCDEKEVTLYRLYNPNAKGAGAHHYTTNAGERNALVKIGWKDEGIAWYGCKNK